MHYYTGIGSRKTPQDVLKLMEKLAVALSDEGYILRSGHAPGADQAFERGAGVTAEIYLPWKDFELDVPARASVIFDEPTPEAYVIARRFHPGWDRLTPGVRRLHARNVHQVLGPELLGSQPSQMSDFVICWTPDGSLNGQSSACGGTGQALRIAANRQIPVYNLAREEHREKFEEKVAIL